jgi:hypothetical protein
LKKRIECLDGIITKERGNVSSHPACALKLYRQTLEFYFKSVRSFILLRGKKGCSEIEDEECLDEDDGEEVDPEEDDMPIFRRKEITKQEKAYDSVWDDEFSSRKFLSNRSSSTSSTTVAASFR